MTFISVSLAFRTDEYVSNSLATSQCGAALLIKALQQPGSIIALMHIHGDQLHWSISSPCILLHVRCCATFLPHAPYSKMNTHHHFITPITTPPQPSSLHHTRHQSITLITIPSNPTPLHHHYSITPITSPRRPLPIHHTHYPSITLITPPSNPPPLLTLQLPVSHHGA